MFTATLRRSVILSIFFACVAGAQPPEPVPLNRAAHQYLQLLENFAGWCDEHWNEKDQAFDAKGSGVTWARGNGGVCLTYAVLLTSQPEKTHFSPRRVPRDRMLDHLKRTIRTLCLTNKNCTSEHAVKARWGGPAWQAGLETMHWVLAAHLIQDQLDEETRALVRQVASAEADHSIKRIPSAKQGNSAADDCVWNAGVLGVAAALYADDPRAATWDEWAKKWALNMESNEADRKSDRIVDGKPLREWLVSINTFSDLTLENHGFWDLPYQTGFAALSEPALAYHLAGKPIPESFRLNDEKQAEYIFQWLTAADGDLLYVQGLDWAAVDVQHSWAFTKLGTIFDLAWARSAEARCLKLLTDRQNAFGDGSMHALDFGYQTDLANVWAVSFLMHKYFGKGDADRTFDEPHGSQIYPYVKAAVYRTPDLISSVSWFRDRQCIMVVPNNLQALGDHPTFTSYRHEEKEISGTGYIELEGDKSLRTPKVVGEPTINREDGMLLVSFDRVFPNAATQRVGYCGLPTGEVVVFSQWRTDKDIRVAELVDHTFYWTSIPGFLPKRSAKSTSKDTYSIDGKLRMQILNGHASKAEEGHLLGNVRNSFSAKAGEVISDSVCIYQPEIPGRTPAPVSGDSNRLKVGSWTIQRDEDGKLTVSKS